MATIPKKLKTDTLIDVVFELRLLKDVPMLCGGLSLELTKKYGHDIVKNNQNSTIPPVVRKSNEHLRYMPIQFAECGQFKVAYCERSVIVSHNMPYSDWDAFKKKILEIYEIISGFTDEIVMRYSLKYVNFIDESIVDTSLSSLNVNLRMWDKDIDKHHVDIRLFDDSNEIVKIIGVYNDARLNVDGLENKKGIVIDSDVIINENRKISELKYSIGEKLDALHKCAKESFFGLITKESLDKLGPEYE